MKKTAMTILILLSVTCLSAEAANQNVRNLQFCPFTDTFTLTGGTIQSLTASGNIAVNQVDSNIFTTGCADNNNANDGYANVTVNGSRGSCNLTILDGPYQEDPTVQNSTCQGGMQYSGMDHEWGTYSYTLKFNG